MSFLLKKIMKWIVYTQWQLILDSHIVVNIIEEEVSSSESSSDDYFSLENVTDNEEDA